MEQPTCSKRHCVSQVKNAQLAGAKGIILYSDPADYFAPGVASYPDGWNLPGGGVQRGNVLNLNGAGDPLTPGYPANGEPSGLHYHGKLHTLSDFMKGLPLTT